MTYKDALSKAAAICSTSEKCENDIRKKLKTWGVEDETTDKILFSLKKNKFIDQHRFTEFFVRDKFRFNKWGKRKIDYELKNRFIESAIISESLKTIPDEEYLHTLSDILEQKLRSIKNKDHYHTKAALIRFATSRGYETDLIYKIVDTILKP